MRICSGNNGTSKGHRLHSEVYILPVNVSSKKKESLQPWQICSLYQFSKTKAAGYWVSETGQTRSKWWWSCLVTVPRGCARIWGQIKQPLQISPAAKWPLAPMCNRQGPRDTDTRWGSHQGLQRRDVPFASILLCTNTAWPIRFLLAVTQSNDALWGAVSQIYRFLIFRVFFPQI
jgi:hypothetical protein